MIRPFGFGLITSSSLSMGTANPFFTPVLKPVNDSSYFITTLFSERLDDKNEATKYDGNEAKIGESKFKFPTV